MDRRSTQKLKLDKRLIRRRGWIDREELDKELEALPDVSHKIAVPEPEPEPGPGDPESQPPS